MTENEMKQIRDTMQEIVNKAVYDTNLTNRLICNDHETRFHFIYAALIVLAGLIGFVLCKAF